MKPVVNDGGSVRARAASALFAVAPMRLDCSGPAASGASANRRDAATGAKLIAMQIAAQNTMPRQPRQLSASALGCGRLPAVVPDMTLAA